MKKFICLVLLSFLFLYGTAFAQMRPIPPTKEIIPTSSCTWLTFYGALCHDIDDGKIYKWNGATQVELAAGAGGDMTLAAFDADLDGFIDAAAGGTDIDTSALTGTPYVTAGVWSISDAATARTNLGITANGQSLITAANYAAMHILLSIDDLVTLSGVALGEPDLGTFTGATIADDQTIKQALQALETSLELKANIASPTFTGIATFPNNGLHVLDTNATHDLIITPGSNLTADRIFTITTGDAARTLTIEADSIINQDLSSDGNPSFSTINVVGANSLNLGTASANAGSIAFKNATNANVFTVTSGVSGAAIGWTLPTAAPAGADYLLNVDADGTMGYAAPAFTSFTGGNWKVFYTNGTGVITELALGADGEFLRSNGAAAAPTFAVPGGAGDVISVGDCAGGACNDETSDGGTYLGLYSASGAVRLRNNLGVMEARTATDAGYANFKAGGFDSELAVGNVGYFRIKEDPANGTNYRAFTVASSLAEDLSYSLPSGNPTAGDLFVLGTPVATVSPLTHTSLKSLMDSMLGSTRGSILYRGAAGWTILTPGAAATVLTSAGAGADPTYAAVTATAAGETTYVQYNTADALDGEAAFAYTAGTDTLAVTNITATTVTANLVGAVTGNADTATTAGTVTTAAQPTITSLGTLTGLTVSGAIIPNAANTVALGSVDAEWSDLYLGDGAIIYGQNDQSATLTSSASTWTASNFVSAGTTKTTGALSPATAGGTTAGTAALPYSSVYIGAAATNNIQLTGTAASAKVVTLPGQTGNVTVSPNVATAGHAYLSTATEGIAAWSTPTYPAASGTARTILVSDGTNNIYSTETWAVPGAVNGVMVSDGTNWVRSTTLAGLTLTSPFVQLVNNVANETWSGNTVYFAQCAASMGFGQPAYIQSTGKPGLADADGVATMPAIGLVVVASTDGDTPCTILTHGVLTDTDWNWTPGATIYVADGAAGALTATVGDISDENDVVQVVGIAIHADSILVNPSLATAVLAAP